MRSVVLVNRRPSLCFVLLSSTPWFDRMPSAFAYSSNLVKPHAIGASEFLTIVVCPIWVINGHSRLKSRRPLYPQKLTVV
jgi:hypothetical protein